jgi:hypothetical protein
MKDNVTPIRSPKGTFVKGVSGNPAGVSAQHAAIRDMQKGNEVLLTTLVTGMVPAAAKLHRALLKNGKLSTKEAIELIHLTYRYGIGTPRQAEPAPKGEEESFDLDNMSPEKKAAMVKMLQNTSKDASSE